MVAQVTKLQARYRGHLSRTGRAHIVPSAGDNGERPMAQTLDCARKLLLDGFPVAFLGCQRSISGGTEACSFFPDSML